MFARSLEELVALGGASSAPRWIALLRKAPQVKVLAGFDERMLTSVYAELGRTLGRWISGEADRNELGGFFVQVGKELALEGAPLSELTLALALARKATVARLMEDGILDSAATLYSVLDAADRIADFYLFGAFYLTKGFLEVAIGTVRKGGCVDAESLSSFFKDDLFFRD